MSRHAPTLTVRDARAQYFQDNNFGDSGYDSKWVKIQAGPFPIYFPNTKARVRAVKLHDIHHILTEYDTSLTGEAEIAAWEIASGCKSYYAAWQLNLGALAMGELFAPRRVYAAFIRGRHSLNLYSGVFEESLLDVEISLLRRKLKLDQALPSANARDRLSFCLWSVIAMSLMLTQLLFACALVAALVLLIRSVKAVS
jgi:hypothetical protein